MKDKVFSILQRVGRSFMLPIAILPVAGLFLGIGGSFTNETMLQTYGLMSIMGSGTFINAILQVLNAAGSVVFENLPLIFAMGVAIGMAKQEKEVSALSAAIAFFIMHATIGAMIGAFGAQICLVQQPVYLASNPCKWAYSVVFWLVWVLLRCTTVFIRLSFHKSSLSLAAHALFPLFLPQCI